MVGYPIAVLHELGLAKHLLDAGREHRPLPQLLAVCDPSFTPPWAVRIERVPGEDRGNYNLILASVLEGYCNYRGDPPKLAQHESRIAGSLVKRLETLWERMLLNVRVNTPGGRADGVSYHFANRLHAGQVWSPRPDTLPWRLVAVAHILAEMAKAGADAESEVLARLVAELAAFGV